MSTDRVPDAEPTIELLVRDELDLRTDPKPGGRSWLVYPPRDLFGIALSGGGIRSATFNLGVLQGLSELRILPAFDYLSTVSGGGYAGSFWTRWRDRNGAPGAFPSELNDPTAPEPREIRHLREFSNFLAPRLGIFSFDTGRMLVSALSSMVPSLLATLSLLVLLLFAWTGLAGAIFAPLGGVDPAPARSVAAMLAVTVASLVGFEVFWRRRREESPLEDYVLACAIGLASVGFAWVAATRWPPLATVYPGGARAPDALGAAAGATPGALLAPIVAWGGAILVLVLLRFLASRTMSDPRARVRRTAFDRVQSRLIFLTVAWTIAVAAWAAGDALAVLVAQGSSGARAGGAVGLTGALALAFAKVQQLLSREPNRPFGSKLVAMLRPVLPQVLAYAVVGMLVVGCAALLSAAGAANPTEPARDPLWWLVGGAALVTLATLVLFNPNEVGLHSFYRSRIVRAYLGASNPRGARRTETLESGDPDISDDVRLSDLGRGASRPFHLVCCAVNDLTPAEPLENLHRGAKSGVLSRVGWSVNGTWARWADALIRSPTLGGAATASGAAFNPLMGAKSVEFGPAVTFLMAAFNLRLGIWLPHPRRGRRHGYQRLLVGLPFYRELLGLASADGDDVHLSDGGHFENSAVYELVRRHCRVILACDCGQDPDVLFDDVGNLVRRVREDFGVDIRIDLSPLRPDENGLARQPMVAGDIFYPDGDTGVLLLVKPTLIGAEPPDVTQYKSRNAAFPHETTGDQFYDAAQWESYRRLGEFASRTAFRRIIGGLELNSPESYMELFTRARREWMPKPSGFDDRVSHVADRIAELDTMLREPECRPILREVYKEIDELDRQARPRVPVSRIVTEEGAIQPSEPTPERRETDTSVPATPQTAGPDPDLLAPSLYMIRRALLMMEEIYQREDLEQNGNHPLYLGLTNYFARWAYAPVFRMWWPLLRTLYTQPFTRFVERRFGLDTVRSGLDPDARLATSLDEEGDGEEDGFAMQAWLQGGGVWPVPGKKLISYRLRMAYAGAEPYRVQAAQVIVERSGKGLFWDSRDFFVPAGLWGVGIGSDFLRHLTAGGLGTSGSMLAARIEVPVSRGNLQRQALANELQLYRSAGFTEVEPKVRDGIAVLTIGATSAAIPGKLAAGAEDVLRHWMVREVAPDRHPDPEREVREVVDAAG
jgi:hypothetical protein